VKLSVICPSWNNANMLTQMINSMSRIGFFQSGDRELIIVNNGKQPCEKDYAHIPNLVVVSLPENKGEGRVYLFPER
jgi:glycosyltransferase involved in cell wall biosynthesis